MIIRAEKNRNYTVINNTILNDERLSWKARGLAAYLLTKPDNWQINREHLTGQGPDGISSVRSALKELHDCGYITQRPARNNLGKFYWESVLHEVPQSPIVVAEKVMAENPPALPVKAEKVMADFKPSQNKPSQNRTLVSTESVSTESVSTDQTTTTSGGGGERHSIFDLYESEIGLLTPTIADSLKEDIDKYSAGWIADAIRIAAKNNVRKLRYVEAILGKWATEGRDAPKRTNGKPPADEPYSGKWDNYQPRPDEPITVDDITF